MGFISSRHSARGKFAVTALGIVSSLGFDAATCCAAARAGLVRPSELDYYVEHDEDEGEMRPVIGYTCASITKGYRHNGRLLRMAEPALAGLLGEAGLSVEQLGKTGLLLCLPSGYYPLIDRSPDARTSQVSQVPSSVPGRSREGDDGRRNRSEQGIRFASKLLSLDETFAPIRYLGTFCDDHAALGCAFQRAILTLRDGPMERCIVGGVDSFLEPEMLGILHRLNLLKSGDKPVGCVPGEAAAFVMLECVDSAFARNAEIQAFVEACEVVRDGDKEFDKAPPSGVALNKAVRDACGETSLENIGLLIGSLNGTTWAAREWGSALTRLPETLRDSGLWLPALSFGETGAAFGALALGIAARAFVRNYACSGRVLVWASSGCGTKAALRLADPRGCRS